MNGKRLILNETAFRLLVEKYQMENKLNELAKIIFSKIEQPDPGNSNYYYVFEVELDIVKRYVDEEHAKRIRVEVRDNPGAGDAIAQFEDYDENSYVIRINLYGSRVKGGGYDKEDILLNILHELNHIYDELDEYGYDHEGWDAHEDADFDESLFFISELFKEKELRARANEAYYLFYNNIPALYSIINKHIENGTTNADDIIRDMFKKTQGRTRVDKLYGSIFTISNLSDFDWKCLVAKYGNTDWFVGMFGENNQDKDNVLSILINRFNNFCWFLYKEFKELLKYIINEKYIKNQQENNG